MSEKSQALLEAALALDPEDRRWLTEALLHSFGEGEADEEGIRIAEERMAEVERGEARMVPWDEAMRATRVGVMGAECADHFGGNAGLGGGEGLLGGSSPPEGGTTYAWGGLGGTIRAE
ncbi:addiction module protein [Luteolibacter soli]|uniref:Addiction module protein n=1 Tax=Luteolibacter soli TaxID=3135280 RepID=A0ABU9AXL8_9BACT